MHCPPLTDTISVLSWFKSHPLNFAIQNVPISYHLIIYIKYFRERLNFPLIICIHLYTYHQCPHSRKLLPHSNMSPNLIQGKNQYTRYLRNSISICVIAGAEVIYKHGAYTQTW